MHTLQEQKDEDLRLLQSLPGALPLTALHRSPSTTSIASSSCASSMVGTPVKIDHASLSNNGDDVHVQINHDIVPIKIDSSSSDSLNAGGSSIYKLKTKNLSTMVQSVAFGVHMVSPAFNFNDSDDEVDNHDNDDMKKGKSVAGAVSQATTASSSVSVSLSSQFANAFNTGVSPVSVVSVSPYTDSLPILQPSSSSTTATAATTSTLTPSTALVPIIEDEEVSVAVVGSRSNKGNVSQNGTENETEDEGEGENGITTYSSRSIGDSYIDKNRSTQSSEKNTDQGHSLAPFTASRPRPLEILPVRAPYNLIRACVSLPYLTLSRFASLRFDLPCLALPSFA